jgi:tripartite-type tricarboxylate transporter receptor subunit TctC
MKRFSILFLTCLLIFVVSLSAFAGSYPDRPITLMVPWSPGGGTDVAARLFAPYMEKYLGTSVVVLNKPGSNAEIGFTWLYNQKPDGYTIGFTNLPHLISNAVMRETKYKPEEFIPLINLVTDPGVLCVKSEDDRFPDLKTFLEYAQEHPGQITVGNSGIGGDDYIAILAIQDKAGSKFIPVPFTGAAPTRTALLGGHVSAATMNASEAVQFVDAGKLRVLAVMSEKRYPDLPNVATFNELGYHVVSGASRGISAPPGVPDKIIQKLVSAFKEAANDPKFIESAKKAQQPLDVMLLDDARQLFEKYNITIRDLHKIYQW